jgi:hypothetical protein
LRQFLKLGLVVKRKDMRALSGRCRIENRTSADNEKIEGKDLKYILILYIYVYYIYMYFKYVRSLYI